jgi:hypothetical protein
MLMNDRCQNMFLIRRASLYDKHVSVIYQFLNKYEYEIEVGEDCYNLDLPRF